MKKETLDLGNFFTRLKAGKCGPITIIPYALLLILLNVISNLTFNILLTILPQEALNGPSMYVQLAALVVLITLFCIVLLSLNWKNFIAKLKKEH